MHLIMFRPARSKSWAQTCRRLSRSNTFMIGYRRISSTRRLWLQKQQSIPVSGQVPRIFRHMKTKRTLARYIELNIACSKNWDYVAHHQSSQTVLGTKERWSYRDLSLRKSCKTWSIGHLLGLFVCPNWQGREHESRSFRWALVYRRNWTIQ